MKTASSTHCTRFAILLLASSSSLLAQTQTQPSVTYDPVEDEFVYLWETNRNRTFFPQSSLDLGSWDYFGALHFGPGSHVGRVQNNAAKGFFRLQYSDLPVETEAEAETADFDLDGLGNLKELQESHTDPLVADTDGDSLPDGWEVAHSISPLDDGSIDPQNGPDGVFPDSPSASGPVIFSVTTNANAYGAGVQAHPSATLADKDGDGIANEIDAGPLTRALNWEVSGAPPILAFVPQPGYSETTHGYIVGCNRAGDVIAEKALYSNGSWHVLPTIATGEENILPIKIRVNNRVHDVYLQTQPRASSVSDSGVVVGSASVYFIGIDEEVEPNHWISHQPPPTTLAFRWDTSSSAPTILAHPNGSVLEGGKWDETAQIASDGTIVLRFRADPSSLNDIYRFYRIDPSGPIGSTLAHPIAFPAVVGDQGFQAFNTGSSNALGWLPGDLYPRSFLADATFKTSNPRSSFYQFAEPVYVGVKPGPPGGFAVNFWNKTMIRHEGRWEEAVELGDATLLTKTGVAFKTRTPNASKVWKGGSNWYDLHECVANHDFSSLYVYPLGSTDDGRVLINHFSISAPSGYGYLIPLDIEKVASDQIAANGANSLPSPFFGGNPSKKENGYPNNPLLMATRTGQQAALKVTVPVANPGIYVGARKTGTTSVLGSASCSTSTVDLSFNVPVKSHDLYEVVAGYDSNSNSTLDNSEVQVVFEKTPRKDKEGYASTANLHLIDKLIIVDEAQFSDARNTVIGYHGPGTEYAGDLVEAFARGSSTIPNATTSFQIPIASDQPGLSHPVGGRWNSSNQDTTYLFTFGDGSPASDDFEASEALKQIVHKVIGANKAALISAYTGSPEWPISAAFAFNEEPDLLITEDDPIGINELGNAFGKVPISGHIRISYKKINATTIEVGSVEVIGSFGDIYDFAYGGGERARNASMVQAGHATLPSSAEPNAGKVFFTRLEFNTGFSTRWNGNY